MGIIYKLKKHKDLKLELSQTTADNKTFFSNVRLLGEDDDDMMNIKQSKLSDANDERGVNIDVNKVNYDDDQCIGHSVSDISSSMASGDDMQFTAEHVLQLCKFLAEKSRKHKNHNRANLNANTRQPAITSSFTYNETPYHDDTLPLSPSTPQSPNAVFTDNVFEYTTANHILQPYNNNNSAITTCSQQYQQHHQQQQSSGKRDILLKIRHQIFERKRQRQLAHMQQRFGVWRPW